MYNMQSHYRSLKKNTNAAYWRNHALVVLGLLFILSITRMQHLCATFAQAQPFKVEQNYAPKATSTCLALFANMSSKNLSTPAFKKCNENITQNPKPSMVYRCFAHIPNLTVI
jgi:hypothetical protein